MYAVVVVLVVAVVVVVVLALIETLQHIFGVDVGVIVFFPKYVSFFRGALGVLTLTYNCFNRRFSGGVCLYLLALISSEPMAIGGPMAAAVTRR